MVDFDCVSVLPDNVLLGRCLAHPLLQRLMKYTCLDCHIVLSGPKELAERYWQSHIKEKGHFSADVTTGHEKPVKSEKICGSRSTGYIETESRKIRGRKGNSLNMSVAILDEHKYWVANFMVPNTQAVIIDVECGGLADLYLLDDEELQRFNSGDRNFATCVRGIQNYYQRIDLHLEAGRTWYLIIANPNNVKIPIFFRVYNSK